MNKKVLVKLACLILLSSLSTTAHALVVTVLAAAPTADVVISNTSTGTGGIPTRTYSTTGQTFTTTSALKLGAIALFVDATKGILSGETWTLDIGTRSGTVFTTLDSESVTPDIDLASGTAGKYLEFTLDTPYNLSASTTYAFRVNAPGSSSNYVQFSWSGDTYSGGTAFYMNGSTLSQQTSHDLTFYAISVPEPAHWILLPVLGTLAFGILRHLRRGPAV